MMSKYAHKTAIAMYPITVAVRFKHIRDTLKECKRRRELYQPYVHCMEDPHFPVPTLVYKWNVYPRVAWLFVRWEELGLSQDKEESYYHIATFRSK